MGTIDLSLFDFEAYSYISGSQERLSGLANYLAIMEAQVARIEVEQAEQLKKDLKSIPDSWSDADQYSFIQWRENEYQLFEITFAESFRYSFLVLVWLNIEDELKSVCVEIQRRKGLAPQQWKSKGVIEQCKEILKETAGVILTGIPHWSSICDLQKIRDCIVHTSGFVDDSRDKNYLQKLVKREGLNLQIDDYDRRLRISPEYCKLAVQSTKEFFTEIFDSAGIKMWKGSEKKKKGSKRKRT